MSDDRAEAMARMDKLTDLEDVLLKAALAGVSTEQLRKGVTAFYQLPEARREDGAVLLAALLSLRGVECQRA